MAVYYIDLAFDLTTAQIGVAAGEPVAYYPLQFAIVDSNNNSWFPIGNSSDKTGGFQGGDSVGIHIYDITPSRSKLDVTSVKFTLYVSSLDGEEVDPFATKPPYQSLIGAWGWNYGQLAQQGKRDSAAYGNSLPFYPLPGAFDIATGDESDGIKMSFASQVEFFDEATRRSNTRTYVFDPEVFVGSTEFGG